jgi:hypothetical protein
MKTLRFTLWLLLFFTGAPFLMRAQLLPPATTHASALRTLAAALGAGDSSADPVKCAFPLIAEGRRLRPEPGTGAERALSVLNARPALSSSILRGRFRIHFDTLGVNEPFLLDGSGNAIPGTAVAFAESAASILAYAYDVEITQLGYDAPPPDGTLGGGPEYDLYITELGSYGYTDFDESFNSGGTSSTFIVVDNLFNWVAPSSNRGLPALRVTLAHEFHHMVQVGRYAFWFDDQWFYELTSTWMEDRVYGGVNDYYNYVKSGTGHFYRPEVPLTESSGILMYSRCILAMFLTRQYGADAMRLVWEDVRNTRPLPALRHVLPSSFNTAFTDAFGLWNAWNAYTNSRSDSTLYYEEGRAFPLIRETMYEIAANGSRTVSATIGSPGACYYRFNSGTKSLFLGFSYAGNGGADDGSTGVPLTFSVSNAQVDNTYKKTASGLYVSYPGLGAGSWSVWDLSSLVPTRPESSEGTVSQGSVFPNPFVIGLQNQVHILATEQTALLSIYSTGMAKVYEETQKAGTYYGKRAFSWDGRGSDGSLVASGVYLYVISSGGSKTVGKFSVVRK